MEIDREVERQLDELGVPKGLLGYKYLKSAIIMICKDFTLVSSLTTSVYPEVGKIYGKSRSRVEIDMRNAIRTTWNNDPEHFKEFFKSDFLERQPVSAEFIATLAEKIRLEH